RSVSLAGQRGIMAALSEGEGRTEREPRLTQRTASQEGKRVLLIYSRVGGGHLSAARALAEEFDSRGGRTRLVDAYLECGRFPLTLFPKAYADLARHHPHLWAALFHGSNHRLQPKLVL